MDLAELLRLGEAVDVALRASIEAGDTETALKMVDAQQLLNGEIRRLTAGKKLPRIKTPVMTDAHREAISKAKPGGPNVKAARKAGYKTRAELATALGISATFLSLILKGEKAMPEARKDLFKKLTGKDWV